MKKIGVTITAMLLALTGIFSQQIPDTVKQSFKNKYPDVDNVQWRAEDDYYYATYQDTGKMGHTIIYNKSGQMDRQQYQVGNSDVPKGISDYYKTHYPNEKNYKVWLEQDQNGMKKYYVPGTSETVYFDQDGKYVNKQNNKGTGTKGSGTKKNNMNTNDKNNGSGINKSDDNDGGTTRKK
jgi:hypothetical protein